MEFQDFRATRISTGITFVVKPRLDLREHSLEIGVLSLSTSSNTNKVPAGAAPAPLQYSQTFSVPAATPADPARTTTAPSGGPDARQSASPVKSRYPGVSMKLTLVSIRSATASARLMEYLCWISSGV